MFDNRGNGTCDHIEKLLLLSHNDLAKPLELRFENLSISLFGYVFFSFFLMQVSLGQLVHASN